MRFALHLGHQAMAMAFDRIEFTNSIEVFVVVSGIHSMEVFFAIREEQYYLFDLCAFSKPFLIALDGNQTVKNREQTKQTNILL